MPGEVVLVTSWAGLSEVWRTAHHNGWKQSATPADLAAVSVLGAVREPKETGLEGVLGLSVGRCRGLVVGVDCRAFYGRLVEAFWMTAPLPGSCAGAAGSGPAIREIPTFETHALLSTVRNQVASGPGFVPE
jgi:hypothetical protein